MHIPPAYIETIPGIYERSQVASPTAPAVAESYDARALQILQSDHPHYQRMAPLLKDWLSKLPQCPDIIAWGGGHPKLEKTLLDLYPDRFTNHVIHSIDAAAKMYERHHPAFEELYGEVDVNYIQIDDIDSDLVGSNHGPEPYAEHSLNTYIHFLEHCRNFAQVEDYILATYPAPILIYGPNIEAAHGPSWFHFRPADHNVFWIPSVMDNLLRKYYRCVTTRTHSDDLLHFAHV